MAGIAPGAPDRPQPVPTAVTFVGIALVVGAILGWGFGAFSRFSADVHSVPMNDQVETLPALPNNAPGELHYMSDISVFDLRGWKPVGPDIAFSRRISPADYYNYLRVVKLRPCGHLYGHYATGGFGIDLQCVSHPYRVLQRATKDIHGEQGEKEYAVDVNIAREPVGKVFLVLIEATYWNGFRDLEKGDVSTYTDPDPPLVDDLSLLVLFPPGKPCRTLGLDESPSEKADWVPYLDAAEAFRDADGRYAYWYIRKKALGRHYRMSWTW